MSALHIASKESSGKSAENETAAETGGIKKRYLSGRNACAVTFRLPAADVPDAKTVALVGDFNAWNSEVHLMRKMQNGDYAKCLRLEAGREYQFRYIVDGRLWKNDSNADKYVKSPYAEDENSVVVV
jgi:1,4-alpha-glucan branching enzyme